MLISAEQIRAARAMLEWTQDMLAQETGLSSNTIHSLENGHITVRSSMEVRKTLENRGFEFFGKNGLSRRTTLTRSYEGADSCEKFFEDMLATAKEKGGEINAIYRTSEGLARSLGIGKDDNLERLERLSKFVVVKCLLADPLHSSLAIPFFQFRATSHRPAGPWSTLTCGDKHAIVLTKDRAEFAFVVMHSTDIAQTDRKEFVALWDSALPLTMPGNAKKAA